MEKILEDIEEYLYYAKELTNADNIERELSMKVNFDNSNGATLNVSVKEKKEIEKQKFTYDLEQLQIC